PTRRSPALWERLNVDAGYGRAYILQDYHTDSAAARRGDGKGHPAIEILSLRESRISESTERLARFPGKYNPSGAGRRDLEIAVGYDVAALVMECPSYCNWS